MKGVKRLLLHVVRPEADTPGRSSHRAPDHEARMRGHSARVRDHMKQRHLWFWWQEALYQMEIRGQVEEAGRLLHYSRAAKRNGLLARGMVGQ